MVLYIQLVKRLCKREILYGEQQIFMRGKDICCFLCNRKVCYDVVGTGSWPFGQLFLPCRKGLRISHMAKAIIALRRRGACRCHDPPQAENPASRILFYFIGNSLARRT